MMQHIETIELDSSQASITFSSIPQDYDDLVLLITIKSDRAAADRDGLLLSIDGESTAALNTLELRNGGSFSTTEIGAFNASGVTTNTFSSMQFYFSNYTSQRIFSSEQVSENNSSTSFRVGIAAHSYDNTGNIDSLSFTSSTGSNLISGCTASLYGITAGGDGSVTTA